jgi:hypothetical protein
MRFLSASRQPSRLIHPKAPVNSSAELAIFSNSGSAQHLPQMLRDELGHLEHTHLALTIEYRPE